MPDPQVLVVGAGPTGLVLAIWLARLGVRPRIIDRSAAPGTTSRALGVQARTLEYYRQLGLADPVVQRGHLFSAANLWVRGTRRARMRFGEMGKGISPYPYMVIFPQDEHEPLLIDHLATLGVTVERQIELLDFAQDADRVTARLRRPDGSEETIATDYLAGCDGARSRVREVIQAGFPGGTYEQRFYVADTIAHGPVVDGELHLTIGRKDFIAAFPMKGAGRARIIGTVRLPEHEGEPSLGWEDVSKDVLDEIGVGVDAVHWFSTYRVHHRVAGRFRERRAFLLGDSAHVHSPAGAQGMNTGIADATNLGWKLAAVLQGRAKPALLDSYEPERRAFALRLVSTTDQAFTAVTSTNPVTRLLRLAVLPRLLGWLAEFGAFRRLVFRTISQTALHYRASAISEGKAGKLRAGDRLPWIVAPDGSDNFSVLTALDWQVHVYGAAGDALAATCRELGLTLHVFAPTPQIAPDTALLIRPDGYVGFIGAEPAALRRYVQALGIRPR